MTRARASVAGSAGVFKGGSWLFTVSPNVENGSTVDLEIKVVGLSA
jgi:hypothetical protein